MTKNEQQLIDLCEIDETIYHNLQYLHYTGWILKQLSYKGINAFSLHNDPTIQAWYNRQWQHSVVNAILLEYGIWIQQGVKAPEFFIKEMRQKARALLKYYPKQILKKHQNPKH